MAKEPSNTVVRAWARLVLAQRASLAAVEQALAAAGLPPLAWYDVLLELERAGPAGLRPFELERQMLIPQSNLSRLLDRMQREGTVERLQCKTDGRGQQIVITQQGEALRRRIWPVYAGAIEDAIGSKLSTADAQSLDRTLGLVLGKE